jgi:hypothetical protein
MATLRRIIFEIKRKFQGTDTVDIANIDCQLGPLN